MSVRVAAALLVAFGAATPAHAELYYLIVGGLGGEPGYEEQFAKDTEALAAVARRTTAQSRVMVLQGEAATRVALVSLLAEPCLHRIGSALSSSRPVAPNRVVQAGQRRHAE